MKSGKIAVLALAGMLLSVPLTAPVAQAQLTAPTSAVTDSSRLEVIYITRTTQRRIGIGAPLFSTVGTLPRMEVEVSNPTGSERRYEYLVEWFGQDGSKAQTSSNWHSVYLLPQERQTVRSMGQLQHAYRARLTIRETSRRPS